MASKLKGQRASTLLDKTRKLLCQAIDRLTRFTHASGPFFQSWNLTKIGDWTNVITNGTAQKRTHGPTHELLTAGGQNISTDVKGNITVLPLNLTPQSSPLALIWDVDNKLRSANIRATHTVCVSHHGEIYSGRNIERRKILHPFSAFDLFALQDLYSA